MDHSREPLFAPSRLRRKLQKVGSTNNHNSKHLTKPSRSAVLNNAPPGGNKSRTAKISSTPRHTPTDLGDSKWAGYLKRGGYHLCVPLDSSAQSTEYLSAAASTSLASGLPDRRDSSNEKQKPASQERRSRAGYYPLPLSLSTLAMRRRAKTPVFSVGQLETTTVAEDDPRPSSRPTEKISSVELIAEQYRALLDRRDSMFTDSHSEPPPSRHEDETPPPGLRRQLSSGDLEAEAQSQRSLAASEPPSGSPTSDDGTLVSFEEETVYFKPVSFSPEPLSPLQITGKSDDETGNSGSGSGSVEGEDRRSSISPSLGFENLSLQICIDLLVRDLTSAIANNQNKSRRSSSESSASLQVWVMIEAYERLREQVLDSEPARHGDARPLEAMFDTWLRALYSVHDSLAGDGRTSEGEYEVLELAIEELAIEELD